MCIFRLGVYEVNCVPCYILFVYFFVFFHLNSPSFKKLFLSVLLLLGYGNGLMSIFLSIQPQINTSVYPTIKIHLFAASKTRKIRGPGFTSKSSDKPYISSIFTLSIMYFSQQNHALNMAREDRMNVI